MDNKIERFLKTNKQGIRYFNFDNLHDLSSFILENKENCTRNFMYRMKSISSDATLIDFTGTKDLDEAYKLLKFGWESGAKELNQKINANCQVNNTFKQKYDVVGGQASVPRYLQGIPTNMILNQRVKTTKQKIINVYKTAGYSGQYSDKKIIEESVKAVEIVNALEKQGYRVNLYVIKINKKFDEWFCCKVKVKSSSERLNLKQMSFCLAHPSFQRRIIWKLIELHPDLKLNVWVSSYGSPIDSLFLLLNSKDYYKVESTYRQYFDMAENDIFIPIEIDSVDEFINKLNIK